VSGTLLWLLPRLDPTRLDPEGAALLAALAAEGYTVVPVADPNIPQAGPFQEGVAGLLLDLSAGPYPDEEALRRALAPWRDPQTGTQGNQPALVALGDGGDFPARLLAARLEADLFCPRPYQLDQVLRGIGTAARQQTERPYRALLVDDDVTLGGYHAALLQSVGMETRLLYEPTGTLAAIEGFGPDLLLLDYYLPVCTGGDLAHIIRQDERYRHLPVVFLSSEENARKRLEILRQGGAEFMAKPVDPDTFIAMALRRARQARALAEAHAARDVVYGDHALFQRAMDEHAIVSMSDAEGRITYANDLFCEISGYARAELLGANHRLLKSEIHPDAFYDRLWRTISSGHTWHGQICNRRKDGRLYWVTSTISPDCDETGRPRRYISIRTEITHQKEVEARLKAMIQIESVGWLQTDARGRVLTVNDAFCQMLGIDRRQIEGDGARWLPVADRRRLRGVLKRLMRNGGSERFEYLWQGTGEKSVWADTMVTAVRSQAGGIEYLVAALIDIGERKEAEARLLTLAQEVQQSEERLRRSQIYANIGTWDWDIQTGGLFWSERIGPLFGYAEALPETSYARFLAAIHPEDRQRVMDAVAACVERQGEYNIEHRIVRADNGEIRWMLERGDVVRAADGTPLHMLGVVQDVTERKRLEVDLREALLEVSSIFRAAASGFALVRDGLIDGCNPTLEGILGYAPGALVRKPLASLAAPGTADDLLVQGIEERLQGGEMYRGEHRLRHRDGRAIWALIHASRVDPSDPHARIILNIADISPAKRYEADLRQAKDLAEAANRAKSEFLSRMSHELRTPLNAILGFAQLLDADPQEHLTASQRESNDQILKAGWHLLALINEVLDLAKIEAGRVEISMESVAVTTVALECVTIIEPLSAKRGIAIAIDCPPGMAVRADRTRLKQVLLNLLSNAIKYNREGGQVAIRTLPEGTDGIRISVTDHGLGLTEEQRARVFEPFTRFHGDEVEGSGIGLTITERLVQLMGGYLEVESTPGEGSCFSVVLPRGTDVGYASPAPSPPPKATVVPHGGYSLLYIEDNPANLILVQKIVAQWPGIALHTATDGKQGLEMARALRPDLILLDINLPGIDGYEVKRLLESHAGTRAIPVIALSANAMPRDMDKGQEAGFAGYLAKPIRIDVLREAIDAQRHRVA
jgi:PAS domain S-box-containing protein